LIAIVRLKGDDANFGMVLEELEALEMEMWTLQQKAKLNDFYHNQMEEFNKLKMDYAFMKA
jgi:hypothetical protein